MLIPFLRLFHIIPLHYNPRVPSSFPSAMAIASALRSMNAPFNQPVAPAFNDYPYFLLRGGNNLMRLRLLNESRNSLIFGSSVSSKSTKALPHCPHIFTFPSLISPWQHGHRSSRALLSSYLERRRGSWGLGRLNRRLKMFIWPHCNMVFCCQGAEFSHKTASALRIV